MRLNPRGLDWQELALRFVAFLPGVHTCIVGTANSEQSQASGLIYKTSTIQITSVRILPTGSNVLLQPNGTYTAAHFTSSVVTVPRSPMLYRLRPVGTTGSADFYMYVSHARSTSDNSAGDARYAEEVPHDLGLPADYLEWERSRSNEGGSDG